MTSVVRAPQGLILHPDLLVLHRSDGTVQLGWGPETAVVVVPPDEMDAFDVRTLLGLLDGSLSYGRVVDAAAERGIPAAGVRALLDELTATGSVRVADHRTAGGNASAPPRVRVYGSGPLAQALVPYLSLWDTRWIRSSAHVDDTDLAARSPGCVVLTDWQVPDPRLVGVLMRLRIPHLAVRVRDGRGVVGPFVVPGSTSCLRCADLVRADIDPSWPRLAAQLSGREGRADRAVILSTIAAAVGQLDAFFAAPGSTPETSSSSATPRGVVPALDHTLEWDLHTPRLTTRRWFRHPDCDCSTITAPVQA